MRAEVRVVEENPPVLFDSVKRAYCVALPLQRAKWLSARLGVMGGRMSGLALLRVVSTLCKNA